MNEATDSNRPLFNLSVLFKTLEKEREQSVSSSNGFDRWTISVNQPQKISSHWESSATSYLGSYQWSGPGWSGTDGILGISAAADTVDKEILLNRLSVSFGIQGTAPKWFTSDLTNRTKYILFNGAKSPVKTVFHRDQFWVQCYFLLYTANLEKIAKRHDVYVIIFMSIIHKLMH